ncbi:MAG: hypothetical protein LBM04_01265, partial [Opitutaceae bacterium]|nr:hypothetical protein [Opitutaceae bacterium]
MLSSSLHAAGAVRVLLRGTFTAGLGGYGSCEIALGHGGAAADSSGNIEGMVFLVPGDSYELALDAWQMQALTLNILAPSGYRVWLDASAKKRIQLFNQNPSEPVTEVYQLEIRPEGAGGAAGTGGGVSLGDELAWGVNLGRLYNGNLAGSLVIRSEGLSDGMFNRGNLAFRGVEQQQVSMIYDTQGRPRQVIAPEVFVDINDLYNGSTVNGFSLDFYPCTAMGEADGSGIRAINSGSDYFVRHTVKLAGGALVASRQAGANIQTSQITQQGGTWMKSTAGELLVETVETSGGGPAGLRTEITTVKDGSGNVARKTGRIYQTFPWADISPDPDTLVDVIVDPDGAALTTHYEYYTDAALTGSYGQIESITYPGGSWAKYEYYEEGETGFGHIKREYHPWLDIPASPASATAGNCHVIEYTYTADWDGEEQLVASRIEKINGVVTARQETEHSFWEDTGTEFTAYDPQKFWKQHTKTWADGDANSEPLVSEIIRFRYDQEGRSAVTNGMVYSVTQPDGSRTAWFRYQPIGSEMLEIAYHGMAAAGDGRVPLGELWRNDPYGGFTDDIYFVPGRSTKTLRIKKNGRIMHEETHVYAKRDDASAGCNDCDFCSEGGDCADCEYCYDYNYNNDSTEEDGFVPIDWKNNTYTDSGRLARVESGGGFLYEATWVDGFKTAEKGSDGIEYTYSPDAVMRVARVVKSGAPATSIDGVPVAAQGHVATDYTYNAAGNITGRTITDDDGLQLQETFAYDLAGRPVSRTTPDGDTTTTTHGTRTRTTTYPGGATRIVQTFRDGQMKSETGTAIVGVHYAHGVGDGGFRWVETRAGSATSAAKTKNTYDWAGRLRAAETPAMSGAGGVNTQTHAYDTLGRLVRTETPGFAPTLYEYDADGALRAQGLLCGGNDPDTSDPRAALDPSFGDRVIEFENRFVLAGLTFWREEKSHYRAGSGTLFRSHTRARLSGLSPALASQVETFDAHGNKTIQVSTVDRDERLVTHTATVPGSNIQAVSHVYNGLLVDSRDAQGRLAGYDYDSLGRPVRMRRPGKTAVETVYEAGSDRVQRTQFADDAHTLITAYEYDAAGNISRTTDAAGATVSHTYNQRGQLLARFGTGAAPVACEYDALGRLTQQTTWGGAATDTLPVDDDDHKSVTTFEYLSDFALVTKVTDALGHATEYAHDALGRLTTLSRARKLASDGATPVTVSHAYDPLTGELTGKTYNDGTPAVSLAYNAFGQPAAVTDALGARAFAYAEDGTGRLLSETLPAYYQDAAASPPAGPGLRRLRYTYDTGAPHAAGSAYAPLAGRLKTAALVNSSDEAEATASHWFLGDAQPGRIEVADATAPDGVRAFHYSWMPQQPGLLQQAAEMQTGLARTYAYDDALWDQPTRVRTGINPGSGTGTGSGSVTLADNELTYDTLGRLATLQQSGALFAGYGEALHRDYQHDLRGQLLAARSYMGLAGDNDRPMPGRQHTFSYDNAGARTAAGHDESLPQAETVNALGQLTNKENKSIHVSGVAVEGTEASLAVAGAGVTVMRSGSASGRFWSIELSPDSATDDTAAKASTLVRLQKTAAGPGGADVTQT